MTDEFSRFDQDQYSETFYYCDNEHPFIAFTTCFCPLCDTNKELGEALADLASIEETCDNQTEEFQELFVKVRNHSPELLV